MVETAGQPVAVDSSLRSVPRWIHIWRGYRTRIIGAIAAAPKGERTGAGNLSASFKALV